jgi:hypothetical protein
MRRMKNLQTRKALLPLLISAIVSADASAFEGVDTMPFPSLGGFTAYPREPDRPLDLFLEAGVLRDDNILRVENGAQTDNIFRYGGAVRYDQRVVGRQRVRLTARGDYYDYRDLNDLDHFAYALLGEWLWEIGNNWSGTLGIGQIKRQVDMGETQAARLDTAKTTTAEATAAYLVTPGFRLRGGLLGRFDERSTTDQTDTTSRTATAAAEYVSPLANTLGLEYRFTNGTAEELQEVDPLGAFVSNDYEEHEFALVSSYALGTQLRASVRLGHTQRNYDELPARDFDGPTGRVAVDWSPGTKTVLTFLVYHEPRSIIDVAASHVTVSGVAFAPRWAVTNQVVLGARFARERRKFEGDPSLSAGGELRNELATLMRFQVGWEPQRRWLVGLAYDVGDRDSNFVGRGYKYNAVVANLAYAW